METQTIKIRKTALKKLRMLHAITGESMLAVLDRLISSETGKKLTGVVYDGEIKNLRTEKMFRDEYKKTDV